MAWCRSTTKVCRSLASDSKTNSSSRISSLGFSGSGFLACYHLGVAKCFLEHGCLDSFKRSGELGARLTGVSGGALIAAAVTAGVDPEVGMQTTLGIAQRTRQEGGYLDVFRPGYVSLIDPVCKEYDSTYPKSLTEITTMDKKCLILTLLLSCGIFLR